MSVWVNPGGSASAPREASRQASINTARSAFTSDIARILARRRWWLSISAAEGLDRQMPRHGGTARSQQHLRAQMPLVEDLQERSVVAALGRIGQHEALELGLALEPRGGPVPEQGVQVVEVRLRDLAADLVDARDVARQAEELAQPVGQILLAGFDRAQVAYQVLERGARARLSGRRRLDARQLHAEDLRQRLGGEQVGLAAPLQVGHQIRFGRRSAHRRTEDQLVAQREGEVVDLDRLEIDRLAAQLGVAAVQRGEVAEA